MSEPLEESPEGQTMFCLDCMYKHVRDLEHHMEDASRVDKSARTFWMDNIDGARTLRKYLLERMKGKPHAQCPTCSVAPSPNPGKRRLYEPYGLTAKEKRWKGHARMLAKRRRITLAQLCKTSNLKYCRLIRCIKHVEPREDEVESAVAVCRAKVK